mmetsp:Transcript_28478/g.78230  ORF Transcript_28478/g.78230 Transcript_28478/m.78230 type:complete len:250 (-) Transcript_28478:647-1396(-)
MSRNNWLTRRATVASLLVRQSMILSVILLLVRSKVSCPLFRPVASSSKEFGEEVDANCGNGIGTVNKGSGDYNIRDIFDRRVHHISDCSKNDKDEMGIDQHGQSSSFVDILSDISRLEGQNRGGNEQQQLPCNRKIIPELSVRRAVICSGNNRFSSRVEILCNKQFEKLVGWIDCCPNRQPRAHQNKHKQNCTIQYSQAELQAPHLPRCRHKAIHCIDLHNQRDKLESVAKIHQPNNRYTKGISWQQYI